MHFSQNSVYFYKNMNKKIYKTQHKNVQNIKFSRVLELKSFLYAHTRIERGS